MLGNDQLHLLHTYLRIHKIHHTSEVNLKEYTYFKTGGIAKLIISPRDRCELKKLITYLYDEKIEHKVIGDTSNMLFLDDKVYGVFITLKAMNKIALYEEENVIEADAGAMLPELARKALLWECGGFEGLEGIPGTVGGGVIMNAGAYGDEIKDCLISVHGFTRRGDSFNLSNHELDFKNRNSLLRRNLGEFVVTHVRFNAIAGEPHEIYSKMELYHSKRHKYQDFQYPTLGSLFSIKDIYHDLTVQQKWLRRQLKWYRRLHYSNKIRRETPINRRKLNRFICTKFGWSFQVQPFSDKTMNCLTNRGQHTDEFIDYIHLLEQHLPDSAIIENEVLDTNYFEGDIV